MLPMRTILTISFVSIFVIFILVIVPSSESSASVEEKLRLGGRVLGATETLIDEMHEQYSFRDLGFPEVPKIPEEPKTPKPTKIENPKPRPSLTCPSVSINTEDKKILFSEEADKIVPIASISKIMTALVTQDLIKDWSATYKILSRDRVTGGRYYLQAGDEVKIYDLLNLSLIASANSATQALVSATGLSNQDFVRKMNEKAKELGLQNTKFSDPVGLSYYNQSTAKEVASLLLEASSNKHIKEIIKKEKLEFKTKAGRTVRAYTTNNLLKKYPKNKTTAQGGKTGHTNAAGYCLASIFEKDGQDIITVVLGAEQNYQRFAFTEEITNWIFKNYTWQ